MRVQSPSFLPWLLYRRPGTVLCWGLSLAVLGVIAAFVAAAAPASSTKEQARSADRADKAEPRPPQAAQAEDDEDDLPDMPGFGPVPLHDWQRQMQRMQQDLMRQMQQMNHLGGGVFGLPATEEEDSRQLKRLGAKLERPSEALVDQLDLPRGQGQVVRQVQPDSAAARAGIRKNDVLLEMGGKAVSSDSESFGKQLSALKANEAIDVVVLRKGKRETLKGLSLPRLPARERRAQPLFPFPGWPQMGLEMQVFPGGGWLRQRGGNDGVMTTTFRNQDRFTTRHQEGSLIISVTGKVADGKAVVNEITVQDGNDEHQYTSVDKVPERYRDKVKNLIEMSEKGGVRVEIKKP